MANLPRQIVEDESFTKKITKLAKHHPRIEEVKEAVDWVLARDPLAGTPVPSNPAYRIFKSTPVGPVPSYRFLYRYDQANDSERVHLADLDPVDPGSKEE